MTALYIIGLVFVAASYFVAAAGLAVWVSSKIDNDGVSFGVYVVTVFTLASIPFAVFVQTQGG